MKGAEKTPVVILAGGRGARFDHESQVLPKPLIEVAGKPILQHIIDSFVDQGFVEFIVAAGYLGDRIRSYYEHTIPGGKGPFAFGVGELPWWQYGLEYEDRGVKIVVVDTGDDSHTGERVRRLRPFLNSRFILTYGDGLSDVDISDVLEEHERDYTKFCWARYEDGTIDDHPALQPPLATLTAVQPPGRFGRLQFNGTYHHHVREFWEKGKQDWINGGFMVMESGFIDRYLSHEDRTWKLESEALPTCADEWLLRAHRHAGYWRCMDTRRDLEQIEADVAANGGVLPWRHHVDDDGRGTEEGEEADP